MKAFFNTIATKIANVVEKTEEVKEPAKEETTSPLDALLNINVVIDQNEPRELRLYHLLNTYEHARLLRREDPEGTSTTFKELREYLLLHYGTNWQPGKVPKEQLSKRSAAQSSAAASLASEGSGQAAANASTSSLASTSSQAHDKGMAEKGKAALANIKRKILGDQQTVVGCSMGHPRSLLNAFVGAVKGSQAWLGTTLQDERAGGVPRATAVEDLKQTLEAITQLCKSRVNRAALSDLGALTHLMGLLQTISQRVNSLASGATSQAGGHSTAGAAAAAPNANAAPTGQLMAIWVVLGATAKCLSAFIEPAYSRYDRTSPDALSYRHLSVSSDVSLLDVTSDLLRAVWRLREQGVGVTAGGRCWDSDAEEAVVSILGALLETCHDAADKFCSAGGLEALAEGLGTPVPGPEEAGQMRVNVALLRALSYCDLSSSYLSDGKLNNIFERITELLLWASREPELRSQGGGGPLLLLSSESLVDALVSLAVGSPSSARGLHRPLVGQVIASMIKCFGVDDGTAPQPQPPSPASLLGRECSGTQSGLAAATPTDGEPGPGPASSRELSRTLSGARASAGGSRSSSAGGTRDGSTVLQHTCLGLVSRMMMGHPEVIPLLRTGPLFPVLLGRRFFDYKGADEAEASVLMQGVILLIEQAGNMDPAGNPSSEISLLLQVMRAHLANTRAIEFSAGAVRRLLANCPGAASKSLLDGGAFPLLLTSLQLQNLEKGHTPEECPELATLLGDLLGASQAARDAFMRDAGVADQLIKMMLHVDPPAGSATATPGVGGGLRAYALWAATRALLLSIAPGDKQAKQDFFTRTLVQALPGAVDIRKAGRGALRTASSGAASSAPPSSPPPPQRFSAGAAIAASPSPSPARVRAKSRAISPSPSPGANLPPASLPLRDILDALAGLLAEDPRGHQAFFRGADGFLQTTSALAAINAQDIPDYTPEEGAALAVRVLRVIRLAVAGSDPSRAALRVSPGFDLLERAIRGSTGPLGCTKEMACELLGLALERPVDGWTDDDEEWSKINLLSAEALTLFLKCLLPPTDPNVAGWGLRVFSAMLAGRIRNLDLADQAGANHVLVAWLAGQSRPEPGSELWHDLCAAVQCTGSYSMASRDLRLLLTLLRRQLRTPGPAASRVATELLSLLRGVSGREGPSTFFHFGGAGSGIVRLSPMRYPTKAYSVSLWLRPEAQPPSSRGGAQILFTLATKSDGGIKGSSLLLRDGRLIVRVLGPKRGEALVEGVTIETRKWSHVAIVHTQGGPLQPPSLSVFVDGAQCHSSKLPYPKFTEPVMHASFGAHTQLASEGPAGGLWGEAPPIITEDLSPFCGQMGGLYVLDGAAMPVQIYSIFLLGPGYQSAFLPGESSRLVEIHYRERQALQGKDGLRSKVVAVYTALEVQGRSLVDLADPDGEAAPSSTTLLEGTLPCVTRRVPDTLLSMGGMGVLFPLLSRPASVDEPVEDHPADKPPQYTRTLTLGLSQEGGLPAAPGTLVKPVESLGLFSALLAHSEVNCAAFERIRGPLLLSHLLSGIGTDDLTTDLLWGVEGMLRAVKAHKTLAEQVLQHLVLNVELWLQAPPLTQREWAVALARIAESDPETVSRLVSPVTMLDRVRVFFGGQLDDEASRDVRRALLATALRLVPVPTAAAQSAAQQAAAGGNGGGGLLRFVNAGTSDTDSQPSSGLGAQLFLAAAQEGAREILGAAKAALGKPSEEAFEAAMNALLAFVAEATPGLSLALADALNQGPAAGANGDQAAAAQAGDGASAAGRAAPTDGVAGGSAPGGSSTAGGFISSGPTSSGPVSFSDDLLQDVAEAWLRYISNDASYSLSGPGAYEAVAAFLAANGGAPLFLPLLSRRSEAVRAAGISLIAVALAPVSSRAKLAQHLAQLQQKAYMSLQGTLPAVTQSLSTMGDEKADDDVMLMRNLWGAVLDALRPHTLGPATAGALLCLAIGRPLLKPGSTPGLIPLPSRTDGPRTIQSPGALCVLLRLVSQGIVGVTGLASAGAAGAAQAQLPPAAGGGAPASPQMDITLALQVLAEVTNLLEGDSVSTIPWRQTTECIEALLAVLLAAKSIPESALTGATAGPAAPTFSATGRGAPRPWWSAHPLAGTARQCLTSLIAKVLRAEPWGVRMWALVCHNLHLAASNNVVSVAEAEGILCTMLTDAISELTAALGGGPRSSAAADRPVGSAGIGFLGSSMSSDDGIGIGPGQAAPGGLGAPLPVPSSYGARGAESAIPGFERVESQGWSIVSPLSTQPMRDNCLATLGMADRVLGGGLRLSNLSTGTLHPSVYLHESFDPPHGDLGELYDRLSDSNTWYILSGVPEGQVHPEEYEARLMECVLRLASLLISASDSPQALSCLTLAYPGQPPSSARALAAPLEAVRSHATKLVSSITNITGFQIPGLPQGAAQAGFLMPDDVRAGLIERVARVSFRAALVLLARGTEGNAREALQFLERRLPFLLDPSSPLSQERLHFAVSMLLELYRRQAAVPSGARLGLPPPELRQLLSCLLADCKGVLAASYGGTIPGGHIDITDLTGIEALLQPSRAVSVAIRELRFLEYLGTSALAQGKVIEGEGGVWASEAKDFEGRIKDKSRVRLAELSLSDSRRRTDDALARADDDADVAEQLDLLSKRMIECFMLEEEDGFTSDRNEANAVPGPGCAAHGWHWRLDSAEDSLKRRWVLRRTRAAALVSMTGSRSHLQSAPQQPSPSAADDPAATFKILRGLHLVSEGAGEGEGEEEGEAEEIEVEMGMTPEATAEGGNGTPGVPIPRPRRAGPKATPPGTPPGEPDIGDGAEDLNAGVGVSVGAESLDAYGTLDQDEEEGEGAAKVEAVAEPLGPLEDLSATPAGDIPEPLVAPARTPQGLRSAKSSAQGAAEVEAPEPSPPEGTPEVLPSPVTTMEGPEPGYDPSAPRSAANGAADTAPAIFIPDPITPDRPEEAEAVPTASAGPSAPSTPPPGDAAAAAAATPNPRPSTTATPTNRRRTMTGPESLAAAAAQPDIYARFTCPCEMVTTSWIAEGCIELSAAGDMVTFRGLARPLFAQQREANPAEDRPKVKRWPTFLLREVNLTRYLLQPRAVELFFRHGDPGDCYPRGSVFLVFPSKADSHSFVKALVSVRRIAVMDKKRRQEAAERLQAQWRARAISNFEYLMGLNMLAGRTYNDLGQYPVFPWVLSDYTSLVLDLHSPATYRDLSKPIGALDPDRLAFFKERFESLMNDPDVPPFHYGSHYSCAAVTVFFLLRLEPFTTLHKELQSGRFDHADRLFFSVPHTWKNCLKNTADVKELTPEWYYQPEFLWNVNGLDMGTRQNGERLGDVVLPPWANGQPDEFIRLHREALESEHVSQNLSQWVDLVFGFKQRGKAAEQANNVFYHLTYEGAVDLEAVADAHIKRSIEDQIRNYGITPSQLFKKRHPPRGPPPGPLPSLRSAPESVRLSIVGTPTDENMGSLPITRLDLLPDGRLLCVLGGSLVTCHMWSGNRIDSAAATLQSLTFGGLTGLGDVGFGLAVDQRVPRRLAGGTAASALHLAPAAAGQANSPGASRRRFGFTHSGTVTLACGFQDRSLRVYQSDTGALLQSLSYTQDVLTCISVSECGRVVAAGCRDTTVVLWATNPTYEGRRVPVGPARALPLDQRPKLMLYGHRDSVEAVAVSTDLDLCFSAAADARILVHSLSSGRLVRAFSAGTHPATDLTLDSVSGVLVALSAGAGTISVYTVNGRLLAETASGEVIHDLQTASQGRFLLTAGSMGYITMRWLHSLEPVIRYDGGRGPLSCVVVTADDCFVAGSESGHLLIFTPDQRRSQQRTFAVALAREASVPVRTFVPGSS